MAELLTWKQVRDKTGMTQAEMARKLDISPQLYQMKETYVRPMRVEEAVEIAKIAGIDLRRIKVA